MLYSMVLLCLHSCFCLFGFVGLLLKRWVQLVLPFVAHCLECILNELVTLGFQDHSDQRRAYLCCLNFAPPFFSPT